jgi:putative membrane protein insertion efficiency factor
MIKVSSLTTDPAGASAPGERPSWLAPILAAVIRLYQLIVSPAQAFLFGAGSGCRFTPTCSTYALEAVRAQGAFAGSVLAAKRICRCHPWGGCGHDPVPRI